jgi:hypothetical protein
MAGNGITYVGRLINNQGQAKLNRSQAGNLVLQLVLAEQHTGKNGKVAPKYQDRSKSADDYVPTTTSWHRITLFGDDAERLATDPDVNHGALIEVTNANYTEEDPWTTKDGVSRAGRPETIGRDSKIDVLERNGRRFGAKDEYAQPIWDGASPVAPLKGSGSGGGGGREYGDDEGF